MNFEFKTFSFLALLAAFLVLHSRSETLEGSVELFVADTFGSDPSISEQQQQQLQHEEGFAVEFAVLYINGGPKTVHLSFPEDRIPENLTTGDWVRVEVESANAKEKRSNGVPSSLFYTSRGEMEVKSFEITETSSERSSKQLQQQLSQTSTAASSAHRRIVILVSSFIDYAEPDCTVNRMKNLIWDGDSSFNYSSVAKIFRDFSNGLVQFVHDSQGISQVDVFGPFSIQIDVTKGCASSDWALSIENEAMISGVDLSKYSHRMLIIPSTELCTWEGLGNVGCGLYCRTWIPKCSKLQVMVHELGHNLGLRHTASRISEGSTFVEYGDPTSVMGNQWWGTDWPMDFVAPHMLQLNWLSSSTKLQQISASGIYEIAPLNIRPESTNMKQMARITHPDSGVGYFFSYRIGNVVPLTMRMLVHVFRGSTAASEYINSYIPGIESFKDIYERFSVIPLSITNTSMIISVTYGCVKSAPKITAFSYPVYNGQVNRINYGDTVYIKPEITENITFTIQNADSALCRPLFFTLETNSSSNDLSMTIDTPTLALWPGLLCNVTVSVLSSVLGSHPMTFSAISETQSAEFTLNPTISKSCFYNSPFLSFANTSESGNALHLEIGENATKTQIIVTNRDTFFCEPQEFSLSLSSDCPIGTTFTSNASSFQIKPWMSVNITLESFIALSAESFAGSTCTLKLTVSNSNQNGYSTTLNVSVFLYKSCSSGTLYNVTFDRSLTLKARESYYLPLIINDPLRYYCNYSLSVLSSPSSITVWPIENYVILRNGVGSTRILLTAADSVATTTAQTTSDSLQIEVSQTTKSVDINTIEGSCTHNTVSFGLYCDSVTLNTPGDIPTFSCDIYIANTDSWFCPTTTFYLLPINITGFTHEYDYTSVSLYPGNSTWVKLTMIQDENNTSDGYMTFKFNMASSSGLSMHSISTNWGTWVGRCVYDYPYLQVLSSDTLDAYLKQTVSFKMRGWNLDNGYCSKYNYKIVLDPYPTEAIVSISPGATMAIGASRDITLTITPIGTIDEYNFSAILKFTSNETFASDVLSDSILSLFVIPGCEYNTPSLTVWPANTSWTVGDSHNITVYANFKNNDNSNCSLVPTYTMTMSIPFGSSVSPLNGTKFIVPANNSAQFAVRTTLRVNTAPGTYAFTYTLTASDGPYHTISAKSYMVIECPIPEAPYNLQTKQVTSLFATKAHAELSWNACESDVACCCPCLWAVYRDGEFVSTTSEHSLSDTALLTEGVSYSYTIVTLDARNITSPNDTCRNSVVITGEQADLSTFYVLLAAILVVIFVVIVCASVVIAYWKWPKIKPVLKRWKEHLKSYFTNSRGSIQVPEEENEDTEASIVEMEPKSNT